MARISEIKGEAAIDLIADIIEPVTNIATDPVIQDIIRTETVPEGADVRALAIERLKRNVPKLIKSHKADVIAVLAALEGVGVDTYKEQLTLATLIRDVTEAFSDPELASFFTSQVQSAKSEEPASTDISTTGDQPLELV